MEILDKNSEYGETPMQPSASRTKLYFRPLKMMSPAIPLGVLLAVAFGSPQAIRASGATEIVSENGTWGTDCPDVFCSAPGDTWSYSFDVDSQPTVLNDNLGGDFEAAVSGFTFLDNGVVVPSLTDTVTEMTFYSAGDGGGFEDPDAVVNVYNVFPYQLYSGLESSPTIEPGVYPVAPATAIDDTTPATASAVTVTPEPSLAILMLTALLAIALVARKRNAGGLGSTRTNS